IDGFRSCISPPFLYNGLHVGGDFTFKKHLFTRGWMSEPQCSGVKCMARTKRKTILNKLFVFGENRSLNDFIAAVSFVVKKGMTYVFHVYTDLMGSPGFQPAFNQAYISQ